MVSVDPADGGNPSESPDAQAYASANDAPFKLANEVAVALEKAFPGQNKMVGLYAYNWHSEPPAFKLEPNVYVQMTMGFLQSNYSIDQLMDMWSKKATNLGFYDYYSTFRWDNDIWPGGRVARKQYPIGMIKTFQEVNAKSGAFATSISAESGGNWALHGRSYYLASKLMWNPDLNPEAILEDFYDKAFGPAAAAMKKYYSYQDNPPKMAPGVVGNLWRALKEARDAAKDRPDVLGRLDDLTNYMQYYDLGYRGAEGRQLAQWTLAYRNRYSYMHHWEAIRQDAIHDTGDANAEWRVDKPITRAETEAWLAEGAKRYPELKIPVQLEYSKNWVPVNLGGAKKGFKSATFQSGLRVVLHSIKGEPLEINLIAGSMYGGSGHSYEITDTKGKVIASGKPKAQETIPLKVAVPAAGTYFLDYVDGRGDCWLFNVPETQPMAFDLDKLASATTLYQQTPDLYFYVPKGTKSIEYYFNITPYSASDAHDVYGPDDKMVQEVRVSANYVSVPVPAGMDGKAWHFAGPRFGLGYFHFYNCPNVLSPSPAQMLLPKSIVEKDGLTVLK